MAADIRITVGSDIHYEDLVGEIYYHDNFVCRISQERGLDRASIELPIPGGTGTRLQSMPLDVFEKAVADVVQRLWNQRRNESQ